MIFYYRLNNEIYQIEADRYTHGGGPTVLVEIDSTPDCYTAVTLTVEYAVPIDIKGLIATDIGIAGVDDACRPPTPFAGIKRGFRLAGAGWISEILAANAGVKAVRIVRLPECTTAFYRAESEFLRVATCDVWEDPRNPGCTDCCRELAQIARSITI